MPEDLNARDLKLVQWLNEAYAKEAELEADLAAHIALTRKDSYKLRLRRHLSETRDHKRRVAARIKQLGGSASSGPSLPGVPEAVGEVAGKAVATVKGQVGTARAVLTSQPETHMRNAQEELREEHVEMAIYTRIETLATEVGDRETAQLARSIRRDEERMAKFLDAELSRLVKEVVRTEIPRELRVSAAPRRTRSTTASRPASRARAATGSSSRSTRAGSGSSTRSTRTASGSSSRSTRTTSGSSSRNTRTPASSRGRRPPRS
ncbi:MAG: DUF892 family protein [Solirubrobacterales bacterium]|nr:DUF892 family protein [Solirubrobacterales bacterium]MBV9714860.1 DUF892 family protein [Solirubrobacterales bacterium]